MRMSETRQHNEHGFSLLELLVVLCVVGLLSAAGGAVLSGGEGRHMQRTAQSMITLIKAAKRDAQTSGAVQQIEINSRTVSVPDSGLTVKHHGQAGFRLLAAVTPGISQSAIMFYPDGSSSGGVIEISAADMTLNIEVDPLGRLNVSK